MILLRADQSSIADREDFEALIEVILGMEDAVSPYGHRFYVVRLAGEANVPLDPVARALRTSG